MFTPLTLYYFIERISVCRFFTDLTLDLTPSGCVLKYVERVVLIKKRGIRERNIIVILCELLDPSLNKINE